MDLLEQNRLGDYWNAANYLAAAQIYLRDNVLLRQPLEANHIKPRLLGHWGTVPGINFVYTHLNRLIAQQQQPVLLVTGPGHGAPANLANLYLEGSLGERYPRYRRSSEGLQNLVRSFSWPGGFPSHLTPETPGAIHEGGELGYALATAFGAAMDSPDLLVACIVGDGEAETGPTATAWHSPKYLNPARDGAVLPILHLNEYKIASRTIYGSMSNDELVSLMIGYGYVPIIVEVRHSDSADEDANRDAKRDAIDDAHQQMAAAIDEAWHLIRQIQTAWRDGTVRVTPRWPMLILRSPKGWTTAQELGGVPLEGTYRAHQVPISDPRGNEQHLNALETWLRSYRPDRLFDQEGNPTGDWIKSVPPDSLRMGMVPQSNGGAIRQPLTLPDWQTVGIEIDQNNRGSKVSSDTTVGGKWLSEVLKKNRNRFRIFCPDEMDSNRLSAVFDVTDRQFLWPVGDSDEHIGHEGNVLEILSEHTCQAWLQGYLLTGRHGLFPCYEAFVSIVDSMMGQYAKFLKRADELPWRPPVSSFNYLLSSEGWRQDHNGYSHQMPGFLNMLLNKKAQNVRVYLPPDTNCLLSTLHHCCDSTDKINLIIASKQPMPQWLSINEAAEHCRQGISTWSWAGNLPAGADPSKPDIVLAGAGVYPMAEVMVAAWHLQTQLPQINLRVINVTDLLILEHDSYHPHGLDDETFANYFPPDCPVVFNFHGYPSAVKQLLWERPGHRRFRINGYIEEGTTTTPFSLLAANGVDRYTLLDQTLDAVADRRSDLQSEITRLRERFAQRRQSLLDFAEKHGHDADEVQRWSRGDVEVLK